MPAASRDSDDASGYAAWFRPPDRHVILFILVLVVPIAEIATFVWVGAHLGVGMTLLLVVMGMVAGLWLVRRQGLATAARVQAMIARGEPVAEGMLEGLALLIAGMLLVLPGFLTDIAGLLLLLPPLRRWGIRLYLRQAGLGGRLTRYPGEPGTSGRAPLEGKSRRLD
jgi:UPF0716 protein FxsA